MHFTSFSNLQILLEIQFCAEAPGKKWGLAMWPSGMAAGGSGCGVGRGRWGEGLVSHLWSICARSWDRGGLGGGVGR
jgi:hypothetical protein